MRFATFAGARARQRLADGSTDDVSRGAANARADAAGHSPDSGGVWRLRSVTIDVTCEVLKSWRAPAGEVRQTIRGAGQRYPADRPTHGKQPVGRETCSPGEKHPGAPRVAVERGGT
jgi:hypothetical protein